MDGEVIWKEIRRQRYRCKNCDLKMWDHVVNLDTYRRKTIRLMNFLNQTMKK